MTLFPPGPISSGRRLAPAALLLTMLGVAACAGPPQPVHESADAAATAACRQRADEVYAKQNRGEVYSTDTFDTSGRDSPFSTGTMRSLPNRGLSGEYERDTMVSDCLAGTGAARGPSTSAAPVPSATPPATQP